MCRCRILIWFLALLFVVNGYPESGLWGGHLAEHLMMSLRAAGKAGVTRGSSFCIDIQAETGKFKVIRYYSILFSLTLNSKDVKHLLIYKQSKMRCQKRGHFIHQ